MTRLSVILFGVLFSVITMAQGDAQVRSKAAALFEEHSYLEALPLYSQLVSLNPSDRDLNYRFGTCLLFSSDDKDKAIGHLKFAVQDPAIPPAAWYWLGRAYHLNYQFKDAQAAYQRYQGTGSKEELEGFSVAALDNQCRNGLRLLNNLKEITVRNKVETEETEFFRFYELEDIGGRIVVLPEELKSSLDKKSKERTLVYLPSKGGAIYFSSYGKDGKTGRDIYRTELLPDGSFASPIKLAGYVNTDQDDDFAFLHPDGKSFYFSSKGHNSMGGYDVFRSAYDKGLDTFGPPVNLDFAVNTPDNELFYMTDAESKEACFASGRDSKQGKLHVYRVSTAQVPLVITVLKGTFASTFDPDDRKAHIMVEDAVTREKVADVRTDMNGSYILALPRSGKFRYLVECGPSGRTHVGLVDVPRTTTPRAYRQELELGRQGDLEKLAIRNYFDTPLEEDMMALMMEEIKRRAKLDITSEAPVAAIAEEPGTISDDPLTQAGFSGDITEAKAVAMAKADVAEQAEQTADLDMQSKQAYGLAIDAATEADRAARGSEALVAKADGVDDEEARKEIMVNAAKERQRSREANLRARAAFRTGQELENEATASDQRHKEAAKATTDLEQAIAAQQKAEMTAQLRILKERLDAKSGPQSNLTVAERTRRTLVEQEKEAARAFSSANAKRTEENELTDRLARAKRERGETNKKSRKDELDRDITEQEQQLSYLKKEVDGAFNKAKELERETAVMRGQHDLTQYLTVAQRPNAATEMSKDQVVGLGQRIAGTEGRIASLQVDERYDALVVTDQTASESRSFNWELASTADAIAQRSATVAQQRDASGDASVAANRPTTAMATEPTPGSVRYTDVAEVPATRDPDDLASASGVAGGGNTELDQERSEEGTDRVDGSTNALNATDSVLATDTTTKNDPETGTIAQVAQQGSGTTTLGTDGDELASNGENVAKGVSDGSNSDPVRKDGTANDATNDVLKGTVDEQQRSEAETSDVAFNAPATSSGEQQKNTSDSSTGNDALDLATTSSGTSTGDPEMEDFLLANKKAELEQSLAAEKNIVRRDQLRVELQNVEAEMAERTEQKSIATTAPTEDLAIEGVDMRRSPVTFYPVTKDEDIVTMLFQDYEADKLRLSQLEEGETKADGLSGLELMLADSLRGEMVRQAAVLELAPQQAEVILPKMERLRMIRQEHIQQATSIQREHQALLTRTAPIEAPGLERQVRTTAYAPGEDPVTDRFISMVPDPQEIYASKVEHRSNKVDEALGYKEKDLARMQQLDLEIDSIEASMPGLPRKEYDKLRKSADKLIDERMIIRADLGQRSAFLMKEEWNTAKDSLKMIDKLLVPRGLAPDENLVLMAQTMQADARSRFGEAEVLRKKADRTEDILMRDSLLRTAYGMELEALGEADRAITVKTYLLSDQFQRGESLSYEAIARRVLDLDEPALATATIPSQSITNSKITERVVQHVEEPAVAIVRKTVDSDPEGSVVPDITSAGSEVNDRTDTETSSGSASETTVAGGTLTADNDEAATERARAEAIELANRTEATLAPKERLPVKRYEDFLRGENVILKQEALDPDLDPHLLAIHAERAVQTSASLEARSLEMADRAAAVEDSLVTVRKRDREELAVLAMRLRTSSDSLHTASLALAEEARVLELRRRDAEQAKVLHDRLVKYYYLSAEEQALVVGNPDESRYFQAKARALEQYDAATEAEESARIDRELARVMLNEAGNLDRERLSGRLSPAQADVKREVLRTRADVMLSRADSLTNIAARLRGAAGINEGQAAVMLQALPADRSTETMALEMRTRRTEALLAETREVGLADRAPLEGSTTDRTNANDAANASGSVENADTRTGDRPGSRAITLPFGTDGRSASAPVARPIAEVPDFADGSAFPMQLVTDIFTLRAATDRAPAPIPMDARMPEGLVFKVQIGAFRKAISETAFSDMTPVMGEHAGNGFIRYTAGLFTGFDQAAAAKDKVRDRGYRDAFVVAYRDGVRVPLGEAMRESRAQEEQGTIAAITPPPTAVSTSGAVPSQRTEGNTVLEPATAPRTAEVRPAAVIQAPIIVSPTTGTTTSTTKPSVSGSATDAIVNEPATAEEVIAQFIPKADARSYYDVPGAAPAEQVETIAGLFYTVQVGVYSKPVALDKLFNIAPLNSERTETAKIRYTTGRYTDTEQARVRKDEAVTLGVKDAFVTAYLNGKRIPMKEAAALLERFGAEILAKP
ncbi:MAG: PD40 domain-containing protein [Flavobacteriales bacterium]|nr:PD40 domain-containing protein [Flavobacteriales bacterium]